MSSAGAATGGAGTDESANIATRIKKGETIPFADFWNYYTLKVPTSGPVRYTRDGANIIIHHSIKEIKNVRINKQDDETPILGTIFGFQEFEAYGHIPFLAVKVEGKIITIPKASIESITFNFKPSNVKGGRRRKTRRHRHRRSRRQTRSQRRQRHIFTPVSSVL
jgi:hypothetical protein